MSAEAFCFVLRLLAEKAIIFRPGSEIQRKFFYSALNNPQGVDLVRSFAD
jgi:hypothetical protein